MAISESAVPLINMALIVWLLLAMAIGYKKGFIWQLIRLLGVLVAVFIAWITAPGIANVINLYPKSLAPFKNTPIGLLFYQRLNFYAWFLAIIVICMILMAIISPLFKALTEVPFIKEVNGLLGLMLGALKTFLFFIVITYILNGALVSNGKDIVEKSLLKYVNVVTKKVMVIVGNSFSENIAIQKMLSDPLSLQEEDLKEIIEWLNNSKISADSIKDFLQGYGIDPNTVNELLGNG